MNKDWEFGPHAILLRKERKEGVVGRGRAAKRSREERLSSQVQGRNGKRTRYGHRMWLAGL
jgi:hypothetical protein